MKWLKLNVVQVSKILCFLKTVWTIMSNTLKAFRENLIHYTTKLLTTPMSIHTTLLSFALLFRAAQRPALLCCFKA